jgi:lipoprotein-anchoring transpeptidase ErfK/SrfK
MLRTMMLAAALFAVVPSVSASADPSQASANGASTTTESQSGTTTYFGKGYEAKPEEKAAPRVVAKTEPVVKLKPLPPTLMANVDLSRQTMTVSVNGDQKYRWRISSGVQRFATPTGNFYPQWTSRMWYSKQYDNAPMPNAVFINGGVAVHATYEVAALGRPASHGCIRLAPANARTFYDLVARHGLMRTRVSVHGRPNWRDEGGIARRDSRRDDDDYADNGNGWFWGSSYSGDDDRRDRDRERSKNRKDSRYVYIDGVRTKVKKRKNGEYEYKSSQKRQRYSGNYAYEAN